MARKPLPGGCSAKSAAAASRAKYKQIPTACAMGSSNSPKPKEAGGGCWPGRAKPLLEEREAWQGCRLAQQVKEEVVKWIQVNQRARKSSKRKRRPKEAAFQKLSPDQLVLLLECLLEKKTLCSKMLECLQKTYHLREQDAEVRHRWCELVIKHRFKAGYVDVEKFLKEDQAMGVYLYGEMMVNEDAKQQEIAYKSFATTRDQMDASSAKVVAEMLF